MRIDISIFTSLDGITKKYGITDEKWAEASSIRRPSISELRRLARNKSARSEEKIGRACTIDKIILLFNGLYKLIGGEKLRKELADIIAKTTDKDVLMLLLTMSIKDASDEAKDSVIGLLKLTAQTIPSKGNK